MAFPNGDLITIMKLIEISLPLIAREKEREKGERKDDFPRDFALPEKRREKANRETGRDTVFQFSIQRRKSR